MKRLYLPSSEVQRIAVEASRNLERLARYELRRDRLLVRILQALVTRRPTDESVTRAQRQQNVLKPQWRRA